MTIPVQRKALSFRLNYLMLGNICTELKWIVASAADQK